MRALNERDGQEVCSLLAPGALRGVELPREGSSCEQSVSDSIGYADPRGFPQWKRTRFAGIKGVLHDGDTARVTAALYHVFADRKNISVEDDVVYLRRSGGRWRIVKASAALYRAIGAPEVPLEALEPPP